MNTKTGGSGNAFARLWRRGALGIIAMILAVLTCYGLLALTALLSLLGVRLALDESLWGAAIVLFTVLTVVAVLPGIRAHGQRLPVMTAIAGAALIIYALLVDYHALVEFTGFVLLAAAAVRDAFLHRRAGRPDTPGAPGEPVSR